jgi:16S rRNA (cytosine1402-N4)-methyltransferase
LSGAMSKPALTPRSPYGSRMSLRPSPADIRHRPVMLDEVMNVLNPRDCGIYVDGTFGAGGYARGILERADCRVYAIDRDSEAIKGGAALLAAFPDRLTLIEGRFSEMEGLLAGHGITAVDGVALDIGVSSMQIDEAERGFSFLKEGPLDMRMSRSGPTAADIVNQAPPEQLSRIIGVLGEERRARAIASAIAKLRRYHPIVTTSDLVQAVERATGRKRSHERIHPATRTFQALRIYVNSELEELAQALAAAERLLKPGARLAVVSFHSLEDRIVKRFFAGRSSAPKAPSRHMPIAADYVRPSFSTVIRGHAEPNEEEIAENPRARSAKLRAAERTEAPALPLDLKALGVPLLEGWPSC